MPRMTALLFTAKPERPVGRGGFRCGSCGYGVVVSVPPPACPMCQASVWQQDGPASRG